MSDKLIMVNIDEIQDHPDQKDIYGDVNLEQEFVASIADRGVLEHAIIADIGLMPKGKREKGKKYFLISGHRRKYGSIEAGLTQLPCVIGDYKVYEMTGFDLLVSNINREKTTAQRRAEFLATKQKLYQFGKLKQGSKFYDNTLYSNEDFLRFLNSAEIDKEEPLDSVAILKEVTGYSEWEQRMMQTVFDLEYRDKQFSKLTKMKCPVKVLNELSVFWEDWTQKAKSEKAELSEAYKIIRKELDGLISKLNPKQKKKKVKKSKPKKESKQETAMLRLMEQVPHTYSQTPAKYEGNKSTVDFILKSHSGDIGLIKTASLPCGLCFKPYGHDGFFMIELDELSVLLSKALEG